MSHRQGTEARGTVLVEFALVLPLLALILMVLVDLGLVIREHQLIQNAAREGARFSALPANWISPLNPDSEDVVRRRIIGRVIDYCAQEHIEVAESAVTLDQAYLIPIDEGRSARASVVTISYARRFLLAGAPLLPGGAVTLSARAVFRNLY